MNIQQAASQSGIPAKTLRYYEEIGLISPERSENGYRNFHADQLRELIFLRRARQFGFSLKDCGTLLGLLRDRGRHSHDVHELASEKLAEMDAHIEELRLMRGELASLVGACSNDDQPECAITEKLAGGQRNG
jgi:MerR family transcriptional regulator, copper efflux regulator